MNNRNNEKWIAKRCSKCGRVIRDWNQSGLCSACYGRRKQQEVKNK